MVKISKAISKWKVKDPIKVNIKIQIKQKRSGAWSAMYRQGGIKAFKE